MLQDLANENHLQAELNILPDRPYDVKSNILDSSKLHADTGWLPEVTFENGLKNMWREAWNEVNKVDKIVW